MVRKLSELWNSRNRAGLIANIAVSICLALCANAFIFLLNPAEQTQTPPYRLQPPGFVIGIVWILLFAAMGTARWLVIGREDRRPSSATWVFLLIIFCASYPVYTLGLGSLTIGLAGNIATIALALWVARRIRPVSWRAAVFASTPAAWVAFASYLIVEQMLGRSI